MRSSYISEVFVWALLAAVASGAGCKVQDKRAAEGRHAAQPAEPGYRTQVVERLKTVMAPARRADWQFKVSELEVCDFLHFYHEWEKASRELQTANALLSSRGMSDITARDFEFENDKVMAEFRAGVEKRYQSIVAERRNRRCATTSNRPNV